MVFRPVAATVLAKTKGRVRPAFDLTEDDVAALDGLPPPWPAARNECIETLLSVHFNTPKPARLRVEPDSADIRGSTTPVRARIRAKLLADLDDERGAATRGAYLRGILEAYRSLWPAAPASR